MIAEGNEPKVDIESDVEQEEETVKMSKHKRLSSKLWKTER